MTTSSIGLLAGLLLGIAAAVGGFGGFLIALVLGVVGYAIGGHYDGEVDLGKLLGGRHRD
jgi:nitrate/nitrite transporter NarK